MTVFCTFLSALFLAANTQAALVITEINYNPPEAGTDTDEFIEITNTGPAGVTLDGYSFTQGFVFTFPGGSSILSGESILLAVNMASLLATTLNDKPSMGINGQQLYSISPSVQIFQWTSGSLTNGGEDIILVDAGLNEVFNIDYDDVSPWPSGTSGPGGNGPTLEIIDPNAADPYAAANWRASGAAGGSPGYVVPVPEPSAAFLGCFALLILSGGRRR